MKMTRSFTVTAIAAFSLSAHAGGPTIDIVQKNQDQVSLGWVSSPGSYYRLMTSDTISRPVSGWKILGSGFGTGSPIAKDEVMQSAQAFYMLQIPTNMLRGMSFYIDPYSSAQAQVAAWTNSRPGDAAQISKIAREPWALWLTGGESDITATVSNRIYLAQSTNAIALFCLYDIPLRACGSGGGAASSSAYAAWINGIRSGINGKPAVIILEPNALAEMDCLSGIQQSERFSMLRNAISVLRSEPETVVYIDAGNPSWQTASIMIQRLQSVGIENTHGFALNTANFIANDQCIAYGIQISQQLGNIHFVIDTSRNGSGASSDGQYCNPPGRSLGPRPTTQTGLPLVDGFLWVKPPGESDGFCNGGPAAGVWWADYALGLAQRAAY